MVLILVYSFQADARWAKMVQWPGTAGKTENGQSALCFSPIVAYGVSRRAALAVGDRRRLVTLHAANFVLPATCGWR
jgi:hypothetical protein